MTLATRCAACGTAFRVVQDQLKVANGWVRCGRCSHVFDASDALFVPEAAPADHGQPPGPDADPEVGTPSAFVASDQAAQTAGETVGETVDRTDADADTDARSTHDGQPAAARSTHHAEPAEVPSDAVAPAIHDGPPPEPPGWLPEPPPEPTAEPQTAGPTEPPPEAPPEPPRWLLAASSAAQPVVDIGIGSTPPREAPVDEPTDGADDDGVQPDFVDARFNEDLLAGLPGLRDPDDAGDDAPPHHADRADAAAAPEDTPTLLHAGSDADIAVDRAGDAGGVTPSTQAGQGSATPIAEDTAFGEAAATPAFLRRRGRDDRPWQRRPVRAVLGVGAVLLVAALGLQAALHWRDWLASRWPATAPWLASVCAPVGCRVLPLRRIEDLGVDSTTLGPVSPESAALRLVVVLANRGDLPLAAPSVELALTDTTGELVARKVLAPTDFRGAAGVLKPGATVHWQTVLAPSGEHVAGYTVELFYP